MERKCPRCGSLAARVGSGTSTLLGWSPYYDKDGNYHNDDPNIHTTNYTCSECGQNYSISTRYGKSELHWQENDVNQFGDLFYNSTHSSGEDLFIGDLNVGPNMVGSGNNLIFTDEGEPFTSKPNSSYTESIFTATPLKTIITLGNGIDIEIKHNEKVYTVDVDLLFEFLAAKGIVK